MRSHDSFQRMSQLSPATPIGSCHEASLEQLSASLLRLYRLALHPDIAAFQNAALLHLLEQVPFDGCVWGSGVLGDSHLHHVHPWQVDRGILGLINADVEHNVVAQHCIASPGVAHVFDGSSLRANAAAAWMPRHFGFEQVMVIAVVDPDTGVIDSLGLLRRQAQAPFDARERRWIELLMPHLQVMLRLCLLTHLHGRREQGMPAHERLAISDPCGVVHIMEHGFAELLREQWPDWRGPWLPPGVIDGGISAPASRVPSAGLRVSVDDACERLLVRVRRCSALDRLSPQEQAVSVAYAQGQSHKEVARALGVTPATVRHHLRRVYAKLSVDDKAALAQRLKESEPAPSGSR